MIKITQIQFYIYWTKVISKKVRMERERKWVVIVDCGQPFILVRLLLVYGTYHDRLETADNRVQRGDQLCCCRGDNDCVPAVSWMWVQLYHYTSKDGGKGKKESSVSWLRLTFNSINRMIGFRIYTTFYVHGFPLWGNSHNSSRKEKRVNHI